MNGGIILYDMQINKLKDKRVVILGLGREGMDTYSFLRRKFPDKELVVADKRLIDAFDDEVRSLFERDGNLVFFLGDNYLDSLRCAEVVIKTPGIRRASLEDYLEEGVELTSQTGLFFDNCPARIIGVTGTKGKSTTSSLIHQLLEKSGFRSFLLGNIEKPALSFLSEVKEGDWVVYELSCHQLQGLEKSPHIALFLNFYPEHLDYYANMDEYFKAKANIFLHQGKDDCLIFNPEIKEISDMKDQIKSEMIEINTEAYLQFLNTESQKITHLSNIVAILELAKLLGISEDVVRRTFSDYKGLSHRLEYVGNYLGIDFYDDSIATVPEATIHALHTLGEKVETLILGGLNRGIGFEKIGKALVSSSVKNVVLFPDSGEEIRREVLKSDANSDIIFLSTDKMEEAIRFAFEKTMSGGICLLSPASPSFNMFKDYKERGEAFKEAIKNISDEKSNKA